MVLGKPTLISIDTAQKHSFEFLREQAHLRVRTNTFGTVMRVRSALCIYAVLVLEQKVLLCQYSYNYGK